MRIYQNRHRSTAIRSTVEAIRNIERQKGVTRSALELIKLELIGLATHIGWFTEAEFPAPEVGGCESSCVYRLSQDAIDDRFALYVQSARSPTDTPPHNHDTWAVIAGIQGEEENRFYRRSGRDVEQSGSYSVRLGTAVGLLPDELHSIHIDDENAVINFHMYGLALECLHQREYYDVVSGEWKRFLSDTNIIDATYVIQ